MSDTDSSADAPPNARPDLWVVATWALIAAELALAIFLGLKRPGAGPVYAYMFGPPILAGCALLLGAFGALWSFFHRPFANSPRLVAFCMLGFVIMTVSYPLPFPSYREDRPSSVALHLPFRGEWTVAWGGLDDNINYVQRTRPDRRFGFTFVIAHEGVTRADPQDARTAFAFDAEVLAPCDATVSRTQDDLPDAGPSAGDDLGNHVVLEIAPGEFLFLGNLKQHSLAVKPGEHVTRGQVLAHVGWSAFAPLMPEPHLAIYLQDTPDLRAGQAIPFYFHDYNSSGQLVRRGVPQGRGFFVGRPVEGDRLSAAP